MSEQEQQPVEQDSESEEQRELTEQENEHALVRYSVGNAEENVKVAMIMATLIIVYQYFLFFAMGDWIFGIASTLPYYTMWTVATLAHWQVHCATRLYNRAILCAGLSAGTLFASLVRALRYLFECLVYDGATQWYTTVGSWCESDVWRVALSTVACTVVMMVLTAFIIKQYAVLKRDYPRRVQLDAAVKEVKSQ